MGADRPKQYLELGGRSILAVTIEKFQNARLVDEIILVTDSESVNFVRDKILSANSFPKVRKVVAGGEKRQDSVAEGLKNLADDAEIVCVHDGVRPFVSEETINRSIEAAKLHGACIVAIPMKDTIKLVDEEGMIVETVPRAGLWRAQTPQTFRCEILKKAMDSARAENFYGTDEAMLVERLKIPVYILSGDERNIKITTPDDLKIAETLCGLE